MTYPLANDIHEGDETEATRKTTRSRTREVGDHRHLVSGGSDTCQLQDEVKACTPTEREAILSDLAQGGHKVAIPSDQALAMKADLNIPWSKLRTVRR